MSNLFTGDFYRMADELHREMTAVRLAWGDDIGMSPDDFWQQLCSPSWQGPIPDKWLPFIPAMQEGALGRIGKALDVEITRAVAQ